MSTDSTELTFVRCPSCRSLVPAVSTRCRMCGASLEASGEEAESEEQSVSSGRVRQRTMTQQKSDLNSTAQQLRGGDQDEVPPEVANGSGESAAAPAVDSAETEVPPVAVEPAPQEAAPAAEEALDLEDPLGAYIEEVPEPAAAPVAAVEPAVIPVEESPAPVVAVQEDIPAAVEPAVPEEPAPVAEVAPTPLAEPAPVEEESPVVEEVAAVAEPAAEEVVPQVTIESGAPRGGRKRGLSFGSDTSKSEKAVESEEPAPTQQAQSDPAPAPVEAAEVQEEEEVAPELEPEEEEVEQEKKPAKRKRSRSSRKKKAAEGVKVSSGQQGRLFGWLVSYVSDDGVATELREGKFFVTGSSLKDSDLVLDDDSVSTPHAMARVSANEGFVVQDLMSEQGVFVRQADDDTYHKVDDTVTLDHGDWVKFGDVEFLVSLIAHVGAK